METVKRESLNFIEQLIENDLNSGKHSGDSNTFPSGAQWLFAYWSRQIHLSQLWSGGKIQRKMQSAF